MRQSAAAENRGQLNDAHEEVGRRISVVLDPELVSILTEETESVPDQSEAVKDDLADSPETPIESEEEAPDGSDIDDHDHEPDPDQEPKKTEYTADVNNDPDSRALQLFLQRAAKTKLLTAHEEVDLSKRIKKGDAEAKSQMVEANLLLVVSIAKKFRHRSQSMSYLELINEGVFGLTRATEKFDWRKGYKFSTYATWWIRQSIQKALEKKDLAIRLPNDDIRRGNKIAAARNRLMMKNASDPTDEEIAEATDLEVSVVARIQGRPRVDRSLDQPIATNNANSVGSVTYLSEVIADESTVDEGINSIFEAGKLAALGAALENLPERERKIVEMHYGIGCEKMSYVHIGKKYGISGESVRKIEKMALHKLSGNKGLVDAHAS